MAYLLIAAIIAVLILASADRMKLRRLAALRPGAPVLAAGLLAGGLLLAVRGAWPLGAALVVIALVYVVYALMAGPSAGRRSSDDDRDRALERGALENPLLAADLKIDQHILARQQFGYQAHVAFDWTITCGRRRDDDGMRGMPLYSW